MNRFAVSLSVLACMATVCSYAQQVTWDGGGSGNDWGAVAGVANSNWDPDFTPAIGTNVLLNGGVTVDYNTALYESGTELLDLDLSGSGTTLNITTNFYIGDGSATKPLYTDGYVVINHSGGLVRLTSTLSYEVGLHMQSYGIYNLSGTGTLDLFGLVYLYRATLNVSGGTLTCYTVKFPNWTVDPGTIRFTGGSITMSSNYPDGWPEGEFAFAGLGGGLTLTIGSVNTVNIGYDDDANVMTLSVLGAPATNTMKLMGASRNVTFRTDGAYHVTVNADNDKFLDIVTASGTVTLGGTLTVTNPGNAVGKFDILTVSGGGSMTGNFASTNLPPTWRVVDNGSADGSYTVASPPAGTLVTVR